MSSRRFQDVSSSYTVLVNKFSRCFQDVFTTFVRRTGKTVIYRRICLGHFREIYGQCTKFARVTTVSQVLVFHFTAPFSGCVFRTWPNIYKGVFFVKILTSFKLLTIQDQHSCFPVNIAKVLRARMWKNIRERLLLKISTSVTNLLEGSNS